MFKMVAHSLYDLTFHDAVYKITENVVKKYSRVYTLSKYADTMLTKSIEERTVIGRLSLIIRKIKVKISQVQPQVCGQSLYQAPSLINPSPLSRNFR